MKSAMAKVDILLISGVLKSVWQWIPAIISCDVNAPSFRSFRKPIISASTLLWSFPPSNFFLFIGIGFPCSFLASRISLGVFWRSVFYCGVCIIVD